MYDAEIHAGWDIGGNANGGYLIALGARAMADAVGRPPVSLTTHFLAPGKSGPCEIDVDVVRVGGRMATVAARLTANGAEVVRLLGTFGEHVPGGPAVTLGAPPELPPTGECVRSKPPFEVGTGFGDRIRAHVRPGDAGFKDGFPTGTPEFAGWFEFDDRQPIDAIGLLLVADAFPPVIFNLHGMPVGSAPTLEMTVHVRAEPAPGPLRCRFGGRFVQDGFFEEDGEIWDVTDRLVAHSRQLALVPRRVP